MAREGIRQANAPGPDDDDPPDPGPGGANRGRGRGRGRGVANPRGGGRDRGRGRGTGRRQQYSDTDDDGEHLSVHGLSRYSSAVDDNHPPPPPAPTARASRQQAPPAHRPSPPPSPPPQRIPLAQKQVMGTIPNCQCGQEAAERTVTRETTNKGRKFWTCADSKCEFFDWFPQSTQKNTKKRKVSAEVTLIGDHSLNPICMKSEADTRQCKCNLDAVSRTVTKEGANLGKTFWTCTKPQDQQCGFFEWDDAAARPSESTTNGSRQREESGPIASGSNACYKCGETGHFANSEFRIHFAVTRL